MDITLVGVIVGIVLIVLIALFILLKLSWRVAEPNEALIVTGLGARSTAADGSGLGFKIIVGRGTSVLPAFQTVRALSLASQGTELEVECV